MVVFRGTDGPADLPDLISNASYFTQMVNPWDQYRTARRVFMDVRGDARALSGGLPIEYLAVGHSLGGGLARHMAAAFPCTVAITFNSSFVSNNFRLSDPFINRLKPNLEKRGRIIDIFEERDPLSRVALYQSPHDFFRINDQHQWYRAYNVSDDNGQHGIWLPLRRWPASPPTVSEGTIAYSMAPRTGVKAKSGSCIALPVPFPRVLSGNFVRSPTQPTFRSKNDQQSPSHLGFRVPLANEPALHLDHHPQHGHEDRSRRILG